VYLGWLVDAASRPSFAGLNEEFSNMSKDPGRYLVVKVNFMSHSKLYARMFLDVFLSFFAISTHSSNMLSACVLRQFVGIRCIGELAGSRNSNINQGLLS